MEEKTFYKSRGHWFASKEEAEEWDKRIEAEELALSHSNLLITILCH